MKNFLSFFRSNKRANNEHHLNVPEIRDVFKVVAKELSAYDSEFMYTGWDNMPGVCPYCHSKFKSVPDLDYRLRKRKLDAYYTYDGFLIVSEKFKSFCEINKYENLEFKKLNHNGFYFFEPHSFFQTNIFWNPFNILGYWCDKCKNYSQVSGGVLKDETFILESDDFIMRTDTFRGSFESKSPDIIVGLKTMEKMKEFGLKGLVFTDVWG